MEHRIEPGLIVPTPQPVKTIGILNIVFGSLLGLMFLVGIISMLMMPYMVRMLVAQQKQLQEKAQSDHEASKKVDLDDIARRMELARTDEDRSALEAERQAIEARPRPFVADSTVGLRMATEREVMWFNLVDSLTGLPYYVALIATGIGLLWQREWARKTTLWISAFQILRAAVLMAVALMVVSPLMSRRMGEAFDDMGSQIAAQAGPGKGQSVSQAMKTVTKVSAAAIAGSYIATYAFAMIYPGICLWLMNRPGVRAACLPRNPSPEGELT